MKDRGYAFVAVLLLGFLAGFAVGYSSRCGVCPEQLSEGVRLSECPR